MTKFIFAYHGGSTPSSPEEGEKVMAAWQAWYGSMGAAIVDGGGPAGQSSTVTGSSVKNDGGSNPLSGYTIVNADSQEAAIEMAKGCPMLESGGSVEVAPIIDMS